ncbi:alpha/beta hydrolase [Alteromonas ponticola]|uniref:Alpha/beta hydrolase n=1 Tax=Alteromonas ponticola TaxID=2720613 RepID=A0ABX1QZR6_9ALTE|nr:alpha/beta hydrolase [Alteromonas ponticola]NMH59718.1 alpha/beta hydrolase [Alteromonas ponticola]
MSFASEREETVCGWLKERFMFAMWSAAAPSPDRARVADNPLITSVQFRTADNRLLHGYRYKAQTLPGETTRGYILMALGNAMIADQMISQLQPFSERGYDAFIYDYRGYGRSEGKRRIKAFIQDYIEIIAFLNTQYERHLLYGVSLGGAVIANVLGQGTQFDRAVIDSSPSRFSPYGCPDWLDPVNNIPDNAADIMVITGSMDTVLGPEMTTELRDVAVQKGATGFNGSDYNHPFMDSHSSVHSQRMNLIVNFLDNRH